MMKFSWYLNRWRVKLYARIVRDSAPPSFIARGWAIGMFCGCLIPFGLQLVVSIPAAFILRGSKIGATIGTFITNHFTIFLIYPVQCFIGNRLLGGHLSYGEITAAMESVVRDQSWCALRAVGVELTYAFFLGGLLFALVMTPLTYLGVLRLVRRHRARKEVARA